MSAAAAQGVAWGLYIVPGVGRDHAAQGGYGLESGVTCGVVAGHTIRWVDTVMHIVMAVRLA